MEEGPHDENGAKREFCGKFNVRLRLLRAGHGDVRPAETDSGLQQPEHGIHTSGGVSVREVDPKTMQSKKALGLYFAGEVLDVDAYTGGYNLQIAFCTAQSFANNL